MSFSLLLLECYKQPKTLQSDVCFWSGHLFAFTIALFHQFNKMATRCSETLVSAADVKFRTVAVVFAHPVRDKL